jgi:hypothetical protein
MNILLLVRGEAFDGPTGKTRVLTMAVGREFLRDPTRTLMYCSFAERETGLGHPSMPFRNEDFGGWLVLWLHPFLKHRVLSGFFRHS